MIDIIFHLITIALIYGIGKVVSNIYDEVISIKSKLDNRKL